MNLVRCFYKIIFIFSIIALTNSCNGQNEKRKDKNELKKINANNEFIKPEKNYYDCTGSFKQGLSYFFSIKENKKKDKIVCIEMDNKSICNESLLYHNGELGAISSDGENISTNCSENGVEVFQDYGGGSPLGHYFFRINLIDKNLYIDSIAVSEKVFLDEEVKVLNSGKAVKITFNENVNLLNEFKNISHDLMKSKNSFVLNYLERKSKQKDFEWNIEATNLLHGFDVNKDNLEETNDIAFYLEQSENDEQAIILLEKITQKFPNRVVAYLNLADAYWGINNHEKAKENYVRYISLMQEQKKDLAKIPQRAYERIK